MSTTTFGVIVGNRGFFPDELARDGRKNILAILKKLGYQSICLTGRNTPFGSVESYDDAVKCAALFAAHKHDIDGIIVTLPNFGDERGVAHAIRESGLNVPVLIHAEPDQPERMTIAHRRDSFCGKMSVCNNLRQFGIPYTLTQQHTEAYNSQAFAEDLAHFSTVCRVVKKLRTARIGAIGARPAAFNTVRYSEKLLERQGISVETVDLSEICGRADALKDSDPTVREMRDALTQYVNCKKIPPAALNKMARFGLAINAWCDEVQVHATAIQCWTALEEYFGITPCTIMSMMSHNLMPSACEVDVCGAVSMYALSVASHSPSALADWNNNHGDDPDTCVLFHCANFPVDFFADASMDYQAIIAGSVGKDNTYGTCVGRIKPGPFSFARVTTDDVAGALRVYTGQGTFLPDELSTFGGYGVAHIPHLQTLLTHICQNGFEHHVAISLSSVARAVADACATYLGWDVYLHH